MNATKLAILVCATALVAAPACADWFEGDDHKMHFPQLPDPNGWDIEISSFDKQHEVADDWQCTRTGPVTDIHFWYSVAGDADTQIGTVNATIYKDVPAGTGPAQLPYSSPGDQLWSQQFDASQFSVVYDYGTGDQGFADPQQGPDGWKRPDHQRYHQINIVDIDDPFVQREGEIYWLGLHVFWEGTQEPVGWKTSKDKFMDDATYRNLNGAWEELIDPLTGESLDMAFVITGIPEPGTVFLAVGLVLVFAVGSRRGMGTRA